jgi:peptide subunit release factor 1 (eRF1)
MEEKITSAQKHKLKHFVKELELVKGRHTELVSVYVPQDYDINKIINHIQQEQGAATNIKSKGTRDNVIAALERMVQHLKLYKRTPAHGLCAFAGNTAEREGQQDYKVWSIEPPVPVKLRLYRCDKEFVLDPLLEMCEEKAIYGLVVMDKREGNVALLKGKSIIPMNSATSAVPGKTRAGGQCLDPETLVVLADGVKTKIENVQIGDELLSYEFSTGKIITTECIDADIVHKKFLMRIATKSSTVEASLDHRFFVKEKEVVEKAAKDLKTGDILLIMDKEMVKEEAIISINHQEGVYEFIDISVENENFFANDIVVHNSAPRFERLRDLAAIDFMKKIAEMMKDAYLENKDLKGILVGGPGHTKNEFVDSNYITDQVRRKIIGVKDLAYTGEFGLQELLEKSQDILAEEEVVEEKKIMNVFFTLLATKQSMVAYGLAEVRERLAMGVVDVLLLSEGLDESVIEEFEALAEPVGSKVMIISVETREGVQLKDIGKIAAILRYEVKS